MLQYIFKPAKLRYKPKEIVVKKKEFYDCRPLLYVNFLVVVCMIIFLLSLNELRDLTRAQLSILKILSCAFLVYDNWKLFLATFSQKPSIILTSKGIQNHNLNLMWDEINNISLTQIKNFKWACVPELKILTKKNKKIRVLLFLSDDNRRELLDGIKEYQSIKYENIKYDSNYMKRRFFMCILLFFLLCYGFLFNFMPK